MKAEDPTLQELGTLLAALVDAGLSADQRARLNELLRDNPQAKRFYQRYIELHAMLEWESGAVASHNTEAEADTLSDLLRMESQAHAELVHHLGQLRSRNDSPWHPAGALRWIIQRPTTLAGIAAVLALALILTVSLTGNNAPPPFTKNTLDPNKPSASTESTPRGSTTATTPVATLTNTHNAQWSNTQAERASARGSLTTGSKLHPGTRLTLTSGFAEITTARGAIAILQAPATIELLDNNNAIRLHTGKLVGICETPSSKGFLVRTPHLDITDLGTRFGVDASSPQATTVHVYQGEVELSRPSRDGSASLQTLHLIQGQAARVTKAGEYQRLQADATPFAAIKMNVTPLHGSGVGIERGQEDARWTVVAVDGQPLASPHVLRVSIGHDQFGDLQIDPSIAQWLAWDPGHTPNAQGYNTYRFQTTLDLPASFDPRTSTLVLDYYADSRIRGIWINGQQVIDAPGGKHDQIGHDNANGTHRLILDQDLLPGRNLIQIDVENYQGLDGASAAAVGLIAAWQLHEYDKPLNQ